MNHRLPLGRQLGELSARSRRAEGKTGVRCDPCIKAASVSVPAVTALVLVMTASLAFTVFAALGAVPTATVAFTLAAAMPVTIVIIITPFAVMTTWSSID
jgi:hypothetical protein